MHQLLRLADARSKMLAAVLTHQMAIRCPASRLSLVPATGHNGHKQVLVNGGSKDSSVSTDEASRRTQAQLDVR